MVQNELTYLERQTEARITYGDKLVEVTFHRAKVKLQDELEIELIKGIDPEFNKEISASDDSLSIGIHLPNAYQYFSKILEKKSLAKWQFAYNLLQKIEHHSIKRLKLIVCPENIIFDQGLTPYFLHYGVKESIPPYEDDKDQLWNETKAILSTIVDQKYDFDAYLSHYQTIDLSPLTKQIMNATTFSELYVLIEEHMRQDEAYGRTVVHIPVKRWKMQRYISLTLLLLLIPSIVYTVFAIFFKIPETEAYVQSNRAFLQNQYSDVVNTLDKYDDEKMPYVVQYQLALSYIVNESLTETQRKNIQNTITLQSDRKYFLYWINIGRGNYQEAIDIARLLEDRDLIIYGLLKKREGIKADQNLSGDERKEQLQTIEREIEEYQEEMEEEVKKEELDAADGNERDTIMEEPIEEQEIKGKADKKNEQMEEVDENNEKNSN